MLLEYKGCKIFNSKLDFISDSTMIISNLKFFLHELNAYTETNESSIKFKRIIKTTNYSENRRDSLKILREGVIKLSPLDNKKIKIEWTIKLDILLFWTVLFGSIVGFLIKKIASLSIFTSIFSGLTICIILYLTGYFWISSEINYIIDNSINN